MKPLTDSEIDGLELPAKGKQLHSFLGREVRGNQAPRGFGVLVYATGVKTFVMRYALGSIHRIYTIGRFPDWTVLNALKEAKDIRQAVDRGEDPMAAVVKQRQADTGENTFASVAENWFKRAGADLATGERRIKDMRRLVLAAKVNGVPFGDRPIEDITRSDIVTVLDKVQDGSGPVASDRMLAAIRKVMNWHATRSDSFRSPVVKGMTRANAKERQGTRYLLDDELVAVWKATGNDEPFSRLVRFLLLTGARRGEAAGMSRGEIGAHGWTLPKARNMKVKVDLLRPLTAQTRALCGEGTLYPFGRMSGFSKMLKRLHKRSATSGWKLHDLRRTARTLMSRAGMVLNEAPIPPDHAEFCLGHVVGGIQGVYDKYQYYQEKAEAYDKYERALAVILGETQPKKAPRRKTSAGKAVADANVISFAAKAVG